MEQKFSYSLTIGFGILTALVFWFMEKNYIALGQNPIEIECDDIQKLSEADGKYVLLKNCCTHHTGVIVEENSSEKEIFPLLECSSSIEDSIIIFSRVENDLYSSLFKISDKFENGTANFYEGKLSKSNYYSKEEIKILDEIGVKYSEEESFSIQSGKTPTSTKKGLMISFIVIFILTSIVCALIFFYYKKNKK